MSGNHYRRSNHQMDDAELIKQEALRSKKRQQMLSKALFQLLCFLCVAIIAFLVWAILSNELRRHH